MSVASEALRPAARILLFGATGHISGPAAEFITAHAPDVTLRLATSRREQLADLQERFPAAEVVHADYLDLDSVVAAIDGVDTTFVLTPDFIDERKAMTNVVAAAYRGQPRHLVRLTADPPHVHRRDQVPDYLAKGSNGVALNHLTAREVLEDSGLPVTFVNISATYMDTLSRMMLAPILESRTLVVPYDRRMNFIDTRDVGTVVAKLLLSSDPRHLAKTYDLDNGVDCLAYSDVAALMTEVFGTEIGFDDDPETFLRVCAPTIEAMFGPGSADYLLAYQRWEQTSSTMWRSTDLFSALFDMPGRTLRDWLVENKAAFGF